MEKEETSWCNRRHPRTEPRGPHRKTNEKGAISTVHDSTPLPSADAWVAMDDPEAWAYHRRTRLSTPRTADLPAAPPRPNRPASTALVSFQKITSFNNSSFVVRWPPLASQRGESRPGAHFKRGVHGKPPAAVGPSA